MDKSRASVIDSLDLCVGGSGSWRTDGKRLRHGVGSLAPSVLQENPAADVAHKRARAGVEAGVVLRPRLAFLGQGRWQ
jgi:hypothetical protein